MFFIVSRSDISGGNSLYVPQYSAVPPCYTDVIFLFDVLFTEINAAAAAAAATDTAVRRLVS